MQKERHVKDKLFVISEQTVDSVCCQHNHLLSLRYQILKSEEHLHTSHSSRSILVKLVICVVPGHWKIKILNLKKRNKFICFFMFLYPIQGGKNIGSPYLTNKSWFFGKSDVPGQQNKSYIGVMASKNLIFLMFWLSFVYL